MQFRKSGPVFPCAFGFIHQLICCKEECTNVAVSLRSKLDGPNAYAQPELIAALDRQAGYFKNYLFGNFHRIPGRRVKWQTVLRVMPPAKFTVVLRSATGQALQKRARR